MGNSGCEGAILVRPSFQFYPADWRSNAKLRKCSDAARAAWMDILCHLHDEEEYGLARCSLADLARAAGVRLRIARELADRGVLKGGDGGFGGYEYRPRHAGVLGNPIILIEKTEEKIWFSSRMVRDEFIRGRRGKETRYSAENQPLDPSPTHRIGDGEGERQGDGSSSSSSSSSSESYSTTESLVVVDFGFSDFFAAMPRQGSRARALDAYRLALTKTDPAALLAGARAYAVEARGYQPRFIKGAASWLEDERWQEFAPKPRQTAFNSPEELEGQRKAKEKYGIQQ